MTTPSVTSQDLLNAQCALVSNAVQYVKNEKKVIKPCKEALLKSYLDFKKASTFVDCLEYEEICSLKELKSITVSPCLTTTLCADTALTLTKAQSTCSNTVSLTEAYPKINLTPDTSYFTSTVFLNMASTCGEPDTAPITSGCTSLGCSTTNNFSVTQTLTTSSASVSSLDSSSYISNLVIYETDALGNLINTPISLNLDFAQGSVYYTAHVTNCPSCVTINNADIRLGSPNFAASFKLLMDNVSRARYGSSSRHNITASKFGLQPFIHNLVKHKPNQVTMGILQNYSFMQVKNPNTLAVFTGDIYQSGLGVTYIHNTSTIFPTLCGNLNPQILNYSGVPNVDTVNTTFCKLVLNSEYLNNPITLSNTLGNQCYKVNLSASYTTPFLSKGWYDGPTLLSTSNTYEVSTPDTYTFKIDVNGSCNTEESITVVEGDFQP